MTDLLCALGFGLLLLGALLAVGILDPLPPPAPPYEPPAPGPLAPAAPRRALPCLAPATGHREVLVVLDDPGRLDGPTLVDLPVYQPEPPGRP